MTTLKERISTALEDLRAVAKRRGLWRFVRHPVSTLEALETEEYSRERDKEEAAKEAEFLSHMNACGFTKWNKERITRKSGLFSDGDPSALAPSFELECRAFNWIPGEFDRNPRCNGAEILQTAYSRFEDWMRQDLAIWGIASPRDAIWFATEVKNGRRQQPDGWMLAGRDLLLKKDGQQREADRWCRDRGTPPRLPDFLLIRKDQTNQRRR